MKQALILCLLLACGSIAYGQPYYLNAFMTGDPGTENWSNLGPSASEYGASSIDRGRINALWVNPNDQNCIIAAGDGGGVWKSNDGGNTWRSIIDNIGSASSNVYGVNGIVAPFPINLPASLAVDPLDTNVIYIAVASTGQDKKSGAYGLGLIYTTDGGNTWQQDEAFSSMTAGVSPAIWAPPPRVSKVAYMPGTNDLFAITWGSNQVYMKGSVTFGAWGAITPSPLIYPYITMGPDYTFCTDFEFSVQTPGKLVVTVNSDVTNISQLWVFDTATTAWSEYDMSIPGFYQGYRQGPALFSITSADTAYIQFANPDSSMLLKTPLTSFSPTILSPSISGNYFPGNVQQFAVSPANSNVIYTANYATGLFTRSTIEGTDASFPWPEISSNEHADGRCLYIWKAYQHPDSDIVFFGCDGGICKKEMNHTNTMSITGAGLAANEFYGMGSTEADGDIAVTGAQDNGGFSYIKNRSNNWNLDWGGEDAQNAKLARDDIGFGIGEVNQPYLYSWAFTNDTTSSTGGLAYPVDSGTGSLRPLYFDQNDVGYVGYCHIFKSQPGSGTWQRAFYADPIDSTSTFAYANQSADFYIDENDNDTAYIAYVGGAQNPYNSIKYGKLFYSYNATHPSPIWTNISPPIDTSFFINTIAVDPNNAGRIWVGFGGVNIGIWGLGTYPAWMTDRVWYSDNAGAPGSWVDVSPGLPAVSVNKLLFRKGSIDELYAATDAGVYMWNPGTSSWVSFNNGLPPCVVMDMDFNYCASKLRIATYGRGMWETAMPDVAAPAPMAIASVVTLTAAPLGNNNLYLQTSIDVQAGGVLTIANDTLHMPKDAVISVEPGGKLIVDHSMITNDCDNTWWQGIQARGTCWEPQTGGVYQGSVIIEGGSTIANALVGVANSNESVVWATDGGIIQCNNSYFTDDQVCASFQAYDNFVGGLLYPNQSYFTNCTFLLDNDYKGNTTYSNPFQYMVNMKSVEGIGFAGCQFLNRDSLAFRGIGIGINAVNTGFNAGASCSVVSPLRGGCAVPVRSRFCGLTNGINVGGLWQMGLAVSIDQCDFDTVSTGEYVSAFNDVSTTNCNFNVGHGMPVYNAESQQLTMCDQNIGIYNENSQRFRIEANNFQGFPNHAISDWYNLGTVIVNTGDTATNKVYRDTYDSLNAAVCAIGVNNDGSALDDRGLKILCNTFTNNSNDIEIVNDLSSTPGQGIAINQGLPASGPPAGNTFSNSTNNIVNNCLGIYYYYQTGFTTTQEPTHIATPAHVFVYPESGVPSCPSTLVTNGAGPNVNNLSNNMLQEYKMMFYNNKGKFQNIVTVYNNLIDFGNTASLVAEIAQSQDTSMLYSLLAQGSPYISETALDTAAIHNALPYYSMVQVLKQNPDDLRNNNFLTYVNNIYNFTTADMDTLLADANNTTQRTVIEDSIATAQDTMAMAANLIMLALKSPIDTNVSLSDTTGAGICLDTTSVWYGLDSNRVYAGLDSIGSWLQNIGNVWSTYERVGYYSFMQQNSTANTILQSINSNLLPSADQGVYTTYANIWSVLYPDELDSGKIYSLDSTQIAALGVPTYPGFTYNAASMIAFNITRNTGAGANPNPRQPYQYGPCPVYAVDYGDGDRTAHTGNQPPEPIININASDGNKQFSAYPNPTSGIVTFAYNVQDGANSITIAITNIVGQNIATIYTANNSGASNWDPRAVQPGVYLYQASDVKGIISQGKIVVE